jgi:hypothetical protein
MKIRSSGFRTECALPPAPPGRAIIFKVAIGVYRDRLHIALWLAGPLGFWCVFV